MSKRRAAPYFFIVFSLILLLSIATVTAQSEGSILQRFTDTIAEFFGYVEGGISANLLVVQWGILLLVTFLIYSSMSYVKFPENTGIRWMLSIIVGLLATVFIPKEELISAIGSYTALGITLVLFFPLLVLAFFTFVVATAVNPFGILIQRIAWIIYSVYLFLKTLGALLLNYVDVANIQSDTVHLITEFLGITGQGEGSNVILIVLLVVSIATFIIFVVKNQALIRWLEKEKMSADVIKAQDTSKRAKERENMLAEGTR